MRKLNRRTCKVPLALKQLERSSVMTKKNLLRMTSRTQLRLTKLTSHSSPTTSRSTDHRKLSTSASLCSTHGPTILTKSISSTSWIMTWLKRYVQISVSKTLKSSGSVSSRVSLLSLLMISSEPLERLLTWTRSHSSTLQVCHLTRLLPSTATLCFL